MILVFKDLQMKLQEMASFNNVLSLKATRRDAKSSGALGRKGLTLDGFIYMCYAAPPYSTGIIIIVGIYEKTQK